MTSRRSSTETSIGSFECEAHSGEYGLVVAERRLGGAEFVTEPAEVAATSWPSGVER